MKKIVVAILLPLLVSACSKNGEETIPKGVEKTEQKAPEQKVLTSSVQEKAQVTVTPVAKQIDFSLFFDKYNEFENKVNQFKVDESIANQEYQAIVSKIEAGKEISVNERQKLIDVKNETYKKELEKLTQNLPESEDVRSQGKALLSNFTNNVALQDTLLSSYKKSLKYDTSYNVYQILYQVEVKPNSGFLTTMIHDVDFTDLDINKVSETQAFVQSNMMDLCLDPAIFYITSFSDDFTFHYQLKAKGWPKFFKFKINGSTCRNMDFL